MVAKASGSLSGMSWSWWLLCCLLLAGCSEQPAAVTELKWYVFDEQSGAFAEAAKRCSQPGHYRIVIAPLPADADQQREQLVRRLAAGDRDIDLIGMDVIWTAEFAAAGWVLPWQGARAQQAAAGRLAAPLQSARFNGQIWAIPYTSNAQLLWYRTDRVPKPPTTWDALLAMAAASGRAGKIQVQGERYEGLTVLFNSLLASAGGRVLTPDGEQVSLAGAPTRAALSIMQRLAAPRIADPALATAREDDNRLAFETGRPDFMLNYSYVWPSARSHAPAVARHMHWAPWPRVDASEPARVTIGGINLGIGAFTRHRQLAFDAAACLASRQNQRLAAVRGGLPPTIAALYDDSAVRRALPFADALRSAIEHGAQRPQSPLYHDISLAISHTLHPMAAIDPERDVARLRAAVSRALHSEGLL